MRNKFQDLSGMTFGRWTVVALAPKGLYGKTMWHCKCKCGTEKIVAAADLLRGQSCSCGCLQKETTSKTFTTHGLRHSRIYKTWEDMKKRCLNPNCRSYKNYGGRGIKICDEWMAFEPFYKWAISNGYTDKLTIDRINVNGNYEPSNCRWATMKEQQNNKRTNRKYKEVA